MKKIIVIITLVVIAVINCSCVYDESIDYISTDTSLDTSAVETCEYYHIYKHASTQKSYEIYNSKGKIVLSETTDRPLTIKMLTDEVVDVAIGMGTGLTVHKYYSVTHDCFSQDFSYVVANSNEIIAYIDAPSGMKNRKLIVQNLFDSEILYYEYELDFANVDTPIVNASFLEDGLSLKVQYLSGDDLKEITEYIEIKTT